VVFGGGFRGVASPESGADSKASQSAVDKKSERYKIQDTTSERDGAFG